MGQSHSRLLKILFCLESDEWWRIFLGWFSGMDGRRANSLREAVATDCSPLKSHHNQHPHQPSSPSISINQLLEPIYARYVAIRTVDLRTHWQEAKKSNWEEKQDPVINAWLRNRVELPVYTRKHKEWPDTPSPRDPLHRSDVRWTTDQMLSWMARFGGNAEGGGGGVLRPLFIWYPAIIAAGKKLQPGTTKWMPWSLSPISPFFTLLEKKKLHSKSWND